MHLTRSRRQTCAGALAVSLAIGAGACGEPSSPFLGPWEDVDGTLGQEVLTVYRGEEHCDLEAALFLHLAGPPGTGEWRQFVRDPEGVVSPTLSAAFDGDARLPADAAPTGYRTESGVQLWLPSGDAPRQVFLVTAPDDVEAWPLASPSVGCD
ncbi:hypothetical protein [Modestobacter sp. VKM Ac-2984]|uniref:hypothetical protein n=1 Tax=Modestobacter sp. VKM Ac-2984 TaxID=3004138 RepID=UPI0022AA2CCB|nr:hypothetical protein [Modestobacter sp. VKM Ac-2984]MCZ2818201.1 hypothetical protein [Modestobacter sp. VKM Ac-2984]